MGVKLADAPELEAFLTAERVATLAVPVDGQGTLHIATMNYVHTAEPLRFYFITSSKSEKCRLMNDGPVRAACSTGTYYGTPFTLQMRGEARLLERESHQAVLDAYFAKRGDTNRNVEGPSSVLLEFTPDWARFTDYAKGWDSTMLEVV